MEPLEKYTPVVVVANGTYPTHQRALKAIGEAQIVACCDGALEKLLAHGVEPTVIVGDCDSISPKNREKYADRLVHITEQVFNDLTKTVTYCHKQFKADEITILGATGEREDHTIGNIALLEHYMTMGIKARIITDYGTFVAIDRGATEFESFAGQQVSVFNVGATSLSSAGLQYPLSPFTSWWQGTLNQSEGSSFTIVSNGPAIVYTTHEAKAK